MPVVVRNWEHSIIRNHFGIENEKIRTKQSYQHCINSQSDQGIIMHYKEHQLKEPKPTSTKTLESFNSELFTAIAYSTTQPVISMKDTDKKELPH